MTLNKIIFVVGPTAVGKTKVSSLLAKKLKGEIISCDSAQVYKEISIVNNKPPKGVLALAPHHLIDIISIREDFNVANFRKRTLKIILDIHKKGRIPIIVGGSGLYMSVLLDGIFKEGISDVRLRDKLAGEAKKKGSDALHKRLQQKDPKAASKIHPNDTRRIIRALEVTIKTKKPISQLQKKRSGLWGEYNVRIFALNRKRDALYKLINSRVDQMFKDGILDEIKALSKKRWSKTAQSLIGVREIRGFLKGEYTKERASYLMKRNTRHYAKRQLTWFKKDKRIRWIEVKSETPQAVAAKILNEIRK